MATAQLEKKKERPSALRSIIAGSTAGAVEIGMFPLLPVLALWKSCANTEIAITYPAECTYEILAVLGNFTEGTLAKEGAMSNCLSRGKIFEHR